MNCKHIRGIVFSILVLTTTISSADTIKIYPLKKGVEITCVNKTLKQEGNFSIKLGELFFDLSDCDRLIELIKGHSALRVDTSSLDDSLPAFIKLNTPPIKIEEPALIDHDLNPKALIKQIIERHLLVDSAGNFLPPENLYYIPLISITRGSDPITALGFTTTARMVSDLKCDSKTTTVQMCSLRVYEEALEDEVPFAYESLYELQIYLDSNNNIIEAAFILIAG